MRSSLRLLVLSVSGLSCPAFLQQGALAQQPIELPGIYVQGATVAGAAICCVPRSIGDPRRPTSAGGGGIPLEKRFMPSRVVTGQQLKDQQVRNAADALRSLPGVAVSRTGSFGGFTQVRFAVPKATTRSC